MENYFILLGLSFNPVENDVNKINEAINKKMEEWQKDSRNPRKAIIAKENLQKIPEIKKVMLNDASRAQHAKEAMAVFEEQFKQVNYDIKIYEAKGYITSSEIDDILSKYKHMNLSMSDITSRLSVPVSERTISETIDTQNVLNKNIASQLITYFSNLKIYDISFYAYFNTSEQTADHYMITLAQSKLDVILKKGNKTPQDEVEQKLCGLCKDIFSNIETTENYKNYLKGHRYPKLNEMIDSAIKSSGTINLTLFNVLYDVCNDEYRLNKKQAFDYIKNYCLYSNYSIDSISIEGDINNKSKAVTEEKNKSDTIAILNKVIEPLDRYLKEKYNEMYIANEQLNNYYKQRMQIGCHPEIGVNLLTILIGVASSILSGVSIIGAMSNIIKLLSAITCISSVGMTLYNLNLYLTWNSMNECVRKSEGALKHIKYLYEEKFLRLTTELIESNKIQASLDEIKSSLKTDVNTIKDCCNKWTTLDNKFKIPATGYKFLPQMGIMVGANIILIILKFVL